QGSSAARVVVAVNVVVGIAGLGLCLLTHPPVPVLGASTSTTLGNLAPLVATLSLVTACVMAVAPGQPKAYRLASALAVLLLVPTLAWCRRYTGIGILAMGGSSFWVEQAVGAASDEEAILHLRRVLGSSTYGFDAVENAVAKVADGSQRSRLYGLLAKVAPSPEWQARYAQRAREAAGGAG